MDVDDVNSGTTTAAALTVGEANAGVDRFRLWILAVYLPCMPAVFGGAVGYFMNYNGRVPWLLPAMLLWGVYTGLAYAAVTYMDLFLPRAPLAVREALHDVAVLWVGLPLGLLASAAGCIARTWMLAAYACLTAALDAALVAHWLRLARTYAS
ncbi:hypothetical protein ACP4OV_012024 [Aristida adscensionis]